MKSILLILLFVSGAAFGALPVTTMYVSNVQMDDKTVMMPIVFTTEKDCTDTSKKVIVDVTVAGKKGGAGFSCDPVMINTALLKKFARDAQ